MLHLSREAALVMAAVSAAVILTAEIWEICLAIFSVICSAAAVQTQEAVTCLSLIHHYEHKITD